MQYKTIERSEPLCRPKPISLSTSTSATRVRGSSVIHTLARGDMNGDRPDAAEKTVPSYIGFHASIPCIEKYGI